MNTAAGAPKPGRSAEAKDAEPPDPPPLPSAVFDAHCHLDAMAQRAGVEPSAEFVAATVARARAVGIGAVLTVGDTLASSAWCVRAAEQHPNVYAAVAVHPTEITGLAAAGYAELEALARHPRVVAVGETGLDYYWDRTGPAEQQEHFRRHIDLAKTVGKTLMIHDRAAHADVLRILLDEGAPPQVVFHAFSGDETMAKTCIDAGYVLSFAGVVTFTNAPSLRAAAAVCPPDQVLVETDAPFLTPHPYRGRPNAPYLLPYTALAVARATGCDLTSLAVAIRATGRRLFGSAFTVDTRPTP